MKEALRRLPLWRLSRHSSLHTCRDVLLRTDLKRIELGLSYLLWGGVILMACLIWQEWGSQLSGSERAAARKQPAVMRKTRGFEASPTQTQALARVVPSHSLPSLFHIERHTAKLREAPPDHPSTMKVMKQPTELASHQPPHFTLRIQAVPLQQEAVKSRLNMATQQLLSGQLLAARASFEQVLQQDPHQVVALAGMLVVTSQQGEIEQREAYLNRIRQEIPGYVPEDDLFLMQLED